MKSLEAYLSQKPYPGRGIMLALNKAADAALIAYFIMGRSANSQNRIFEPTVDGIRTAAFDESKMQDPSLIIYHPVRRLADGRTIVTNGDQTDMIRDFLEKGKTLEKLSRRARSSRTRPIGRRASRACLTGTVPTLCRF